MTKQLNNLTRVRLTSITVWAHSSLNVPVIPWTDKKRNNMMFFRYCDPDTGLQTSELESMDKIWHRIRIWRRAYSTPASRSEKLAKTTTAEFVFNPFVGITYVALHTTWKGLYEPSYSFYRWRQKYRKQLLEPVLDQVLTDFDHNLYIRRLPGPSPWLLPSFSCESFKFQIRRPTRNPLGKKYAAS